MVCKATVTFQVDSDERDLESNREKEGHQAEAEQSTNFQGIEIPTSFFFADSSICLRFFFFLQSRLFSTGCQGSLL